MMALLCASPALAQAHKDLGRANFSATFLQLWQNHDSWDQPTWDKLCVSLKEMGIQEIILQWTLVTERAYLWRLEGSRRSLVPDDAVEPAPAVDNVVRAAQKHGLRVRFGLTHDPHWWTEIKSRPALVQTYLQRLWQDQSALAASLASRYGQNPVFGGFYIPQEIDDKTWLDKRMYAHLSDHLERLTHSLRAQLPQSSVAISCFFNGYTSTDQAEEFWRNLIDRSNLDALFIQDGIGAQKLTLDEAAIYLESAARGARTAKARPMVIVEVFAPILQSRISSEPGRLEEGQAPEDAAEKKLFEPAAMTRIRQQLELAETIVDPWIIAFSLPEYATALGGEKAIQLEEAYRNYLNEQNESEKAKGP